MIYHENGLLADDSHEISYLFFFSKIKTSQNLSSAAVVIGPLSVKKVKRLVSENVMLPGWSMKIQMNFK